MAKETDKGEGKNRKESFGDNMGMQETGMSGRRKRQEEDTLKWKRRNKMFETNRKQIGTNRKRIGTIWKRIGTIWKRRTEETKGCVPLAGHLMVPPFSIVSVVKLKYCNRKRLCSDPGFQK